MKKFLFLTLVVLFFTAAGNTFAYANNPSTPLLAASVLNPVDYLKNAATNNLGSNTPKYQGIGTSIPTLDLNGLKNVVQGGLNSLSGSNTSISTPNSNTTSFSTNDIPSALKSIGVLAINLFLIVIETIAGILKALLPFLSK